MTGVQTCALPIWSCDSCGTRDSCRARNSRGACDSRGAGNSSWPGSSRGARDSRGACGSCNSCKSHGAGGSRRSRGSRGTRSSHRSLRAGGAHNASGSGWAGGSGRTRRTGWRIRTAAAGLAFHLFILFSLKKRHIKTSFLSPYTICPLLCFVCFQNISDCSGMRDLPACISPPAHCSAGRAGNLPAYPSIRTG